MSSLFDAACRGKWIAADHSLAPFVTTANGAVYRCKRCRFLFVDPTQATSRKPEPRKTSIRSTCDSSVAWKEMGFKPHLEPWGSAYFDALLDYCHNRQLFLGDDNYLIVCVSSDRLLPLDETRFGISSISQFKVHAIETWDQFCQTIKAGAERIFKKEPTVPYWHHYMHDIMSALRESGAIARVPEIDKIFEKQIGPAPVSPTKKPWWKKW